MEKERERLGDLPFSKLISEVRRLGLKPVTSHEGCVDQILTHYEKFGLFTNDQEDSSQMNDPPRLLPEVSNQAAAQEASQRDLSPPIHPVSSNADGAVSQLCVFFAEQIRLQREETRQQMNLQRESFQQMLQLINKNQEQSRVSLQEGTATISSSNLLLDTQSQVRTPLIASVSPAQSVKLLASQLPEFGGTDNEDVDLWIHKVESVSQIHSVSHEVTLLAATGKLNKVARQWFDLSTGTVNHSWPMFKTAISNRFKTSRFFHVIIQKVEARKWLFHKESFRSYAMDKLALMQGLKLSDRDTIHYLINGIASRSLRSTAVALRSRSIDEFLLDMHEVTLSYNDSHRKSSVNIHESNNSRISNTTNKENQSPNTNKELFCNYCRIKGHIRDNCFKLKKKESSKSPVSTPSPPVAAVEADNNGVPSTVGCVQSKHNKKVISDFAVIKIVNLNAIDCVLSALIDTGSPISLIKDSVFKIFFNSNVSLKNSSQVYKSINNHPLEIKGIIESTIILEDLPDLSADINLHVIKDLSVSVDIVIGRDFLAKHEIDISIRSRDNCSRIELFSEVASTEILEKSPSKIAYLLSDTH